MTHNYLIINQHSIVAPNELLQKIEVSLSEDIVFSIETSGSQSDAKIVLINRQNIMAHCRSFIQSIPVISDSIWLNCMPVNHIAGIMIVYRCWFSKAVMILHNDFNEEKIWHAIHHDQISHISLVPRMLLRLLDYQSRFYSDRNKNIPASLKYVLIGGDRLSESLYHRAINLGWPINISYGMTEACSTIAIGRHMNKLDLLNGISARIDNNGVLQIKGEMLISNYVQTSSLDNGWFKTNDRARLVGKTLSILGRNDHLIIRSGENIHPETIETLLSLIPGVDDIAIIKYRSLTLSDEKGDSIIALVTYQQDKTSIELITQWTEQNIKSFYRPELFLKTENIPRTPLGKIKRKEIQSMVKGIMES